MSKGRKRRWEEGITVKAGDMKQKYYTSFPLHNTKIITMLFLEKRIGSPLEIFVKKKCQLITFIIFFTYNSGKNI
jgi:hypothetical protein